jgi:DNA-binding NtrC family response regulator
MSSRMPHLPTRNLPLPTQRQRQYGLLVPAADTVHVSPLPVAHSVVLGSAAGVPGLGADLQAEHVQLRCVPGGLDVRPLDGVVLHGGKLVADRGVLVQPGQVLRLGRRPVVVVELAANGVVRLGELTSASPTMWQIYASLALAADSQLPVLLLGESGTGKELAARAVHQAGPRCDGPWQAVNCAALHGDTLLAELFGAVKGAYTGATQDRAGAFERAHQGTLFLDEIGELSPAAQAALLRVLEVGEVQVLGGPVKRVDVRVVCATHRDLRREVTAGRFRLDLLYRLAVLELTLPPLRERKEDVPLLFADFLGDVPLPAGAQRLLASAEFPGNLRGLRNLAQRLVVLAPTGEPTLADLRTLLEREATMRPHQQILSGAEVAPPERLQWVQSHLARSNSVADAQRASGLPRGTFFRYLKQLRADGLLEGGAVAA